jgi:hypothetical protein
LGTANSYPDLRLGSANGNNLGIATGVGAFSTSAAAGDMVLRALNKLILQSGGSAGALIIDTNNYVNINNRLLVNGLANINNGSAVGPAYMQSGSLTIGGTSADYGCQFYSGGAWSGTNTAGLLMECQNNTEIVIHDSAKRLVSAIAYYGDTTNTLYIGRAMGWDGGAATPVNIPASLSVGGTLNLAGYEIKYNLFNNSGQVHESITDFNSISQYGFRYIYTPASNSPNASFNGWYSLYLGLGNQYNNNYGAQLAFPRNSASPYIYIRYKEGAGFGSWYSMRATYADTAVSLAAGNITIQGNLQVNGTCTPIMTSVANSGND